MAFHDSVWIVAGTAAPVIALAAVVSYTEVGGLSDSMFKDMLAAEYQVDPHERQQFYKDRTHISNVLTLMTVIGAANILAQCVALLLSMISLIQNTNVIPPIIVAVIEALGIAALTASGSAVVHSRMLRRGWELRIKHDSQMRQQRASRSHAPLEEAD